MEIVCEGCHAKLNIPDEKLPPGQRVGIKCPRCGNKLIIETPAEKPGDPSSADQGLEKAETSEPATASAGPEDYEAPSFDEGAGLDDAEAESALDSYGEGEKLALVMVGDSHPVDPLGQGLEKLGYRPIQAKNTQEAISKLRFQNFDLIVLSDLFDSTPLQQSPILQFLNHLSMSLRRKMFVLLLSDAFRTLDHMMAFAMSANLVANWKDLDKLPNILERALLDNEKFYKIFMDTLKETGKV